MDQSLKQTIDSSLQVLKRYQATILVVVVCIAIGLAVFRLYQIVTISSSKGVEGYTPVSQANASFDQATVDRINSLKTTTDDSSSLQFSQRKSPFSE